ncbi:MAG: hypothetical protein OXD34_09020 [bacterium]|nr:hypothetical protein [bacterium]
MKTAGATPAPSSGSLTVCLAPFHEMEVDAVLSSWTQAGMLGNVVLCSETGPEAPCSYSAGAEWRSGRLWEVLRRAAYRTVTIAALRLDGPSSDPYFVDVEHRLAGDLKQAFANTKVEVRAITVGIADPGITTGDQAFSPRWDLHLLHDRRMIADITVAAAPVSPEDRARLCAMTSLLAGGGWAFSAEPWDLVDPPDGNVKPFRIVRPQIRVLLGGDLGARISAGITPTEPPWPEPEDAGTIRVGPGIEVPPYLGEALAARCGFRCRSAAAPAEEDPGLLDKLRHAVRILGRPLNPPCGRNPVEVALHRLPGMDSSNGRAGEDSNRFADLLRRLRLAGMPGLATGRIGTPEVWQQVREVLYGLVDASPLPPGIDLPRPPAGAESHLRPVWLDPSKVVPAPDAEPFVLPADLAGQLGASRIEAIDVANCRPADRLLSAGGGGEDRQAEPEDDSGAGREDVRSRWRAWLDRWRWTPLWTLADRLSAAREAAYLGLVGHLTPAGSDREHQEAERALGRFRRSGMSLLVVAVISAMAVYERHAGIIGSVFGVSMGPLTSTNLDIFLLALLCAFAAGLLGSLGRRSVLTTLAFEKAERLRDYRSKAAEHYAGELMRLHTAAGEFDDQQVIRTMLHQPFGPRNGSFSEHGAGRVPASGVPASMVVGTAAADEEGLAELCQMAPPVTARGWLVDAHAQAVELWRPLYDRRVTTDFELPDADNSPPGAEFRRDRVTGEPMPFSRAHFRELVTTETGLRTHLRSAFAFSVAGRGLDTFRAIGKIDVKHGPALPGVTAETFLELPELSSKVDWFDAAILSNAAPASARRPSGEISSGQPVVLPDDGDRRSMIMASWRVPLSDPIEPRHLAGWGLDLDPTDAQADSDEDVV